MIKNFFISISKILNSLNREQINRLYILFFLILISVGLETLSIGLIVPVISFVLDPKSLSQNVFFNFLFNDYQIKYLIYILIIFISLIFILKNLFLIFLNWFQNKKLNMISLELSQKLYKVYTNSSYEFHTKVDKSVIYNNVLHITTFITGLESLVLLIAEFMILSGILIILLYFEFIGTIIIIFVFAISSCLIFFFTSKPLAKWGELNFRFAEKKIKSVVQVFTGIKEIKLLNKHNYFYEQFSSNEKKDLEVNNKVKIINLIPRLSFEIIFLLSIFSFLFYKFKTDFVSSGVISILALYAAAFFRILPSISRIISYANRIINISKIIAEINQEIQSLEKKSFYTHEKENNLANTKVITFSKTLKIENISYQYNLRTRKIFNELNLIINFGEKIGIIGETGSGKSTLVNIVTGLLKPNKGNILVDESNIQENILNWQKQIGYVAPETFIINDTIKKNIALGISEEKIDKEKLKKVIEIAELNKFIDNLPLKDNTKIGEQGSEISSGQRQRIGIARALYVKPKLLILDEATSSLNVEIENKILKKLECFDKELTIISISHRDSALINCDRIFKLNNGNLVNIK